MNRKTAYEYVKTAIEASGEVSAYDYDIEAIIDQCEEITTTPYDYEVGVTDDDFWNIVQGCEIV